MRIINDKYELIEGAGKLLFFPAKSLRHCDDLPVSSMPMMGLIIKAPNLKFVDDCSHFLPPESYGENSLWTSSDSLGMANSYSEILNIFYELREMKATTDAYNSSSSFSHRTSLRSNKNNELHWLRSLSDRRDSLREKIEESNFQPCYLLIDGKARWVWVHRDAARIK